MYQYAEYVNDIWKTFINRYSHKTNNHVFIDDLYFVEKLAREYYPNYKLGKSGPKPNINLDNYFVFGDCTFIPHKKLPKKMVMTIFNDLMSRKAGPSWTQLENQLGQFSKYLLYSTINYNKYKQRLRNKNPDELNVLILGGGPTGLYIANYLHTINLLKPRINMLVLDNRIIQTKKGYRLPFTRNRVFGVNLNIFSTFLPKIACMELDAIKIKYLENLLVVLAYGFNIPMYFTDEVIDAAMLKQFARKNKIDMVFDCTGGRLKNDFLDSPPSTFFNKSIKLADDNFALVSNKNDVHLVWKNDNIINRYYLNVDIYAADGKYLANEISTYTIVDRHDLDFLAQFRNQCIKTKAQMTIEIEKLLDTLTDQELAKNLKMAFINHRENYIKIELFEPKIYHKLSICTVIKQGNHQTLYIGAGDTIFSSHFIVGAGLNRLITFINYVIWYIPTLRQPQKN